MEIEYNALISNIEVELSLICSLVKMLLVVSWFIKTNIMLMAFSQCYKSQLVAKGFHQTPNLYYNETFDLVIKPITIQIILIHTISFRWSIRQKDINHAFLHGDLQETTYMQQLLRFISSNPQQV